jgi:non-ribosomal peptide synthetase component F
MLPVLELAILVANMVIVPLDPQQPQNRLGLLVQDSEPWIVVTDGEHASHGQTLVSALSPVVVSVRALLKTSKGGARPLPDPIESSISHVFFTSGSTGRPKGCISTHGALAAYCVDKNEDMGVSQTSRVFAASPLSFDPSLGEFMSTWVAGGTLLMAGASSTSLLQQHTALWQHHTVP